MKRKHIGLLIGSFFIVAFIALIVATAIIVQKVIEDEQYKESYYASQYGLNQQDDTTANIPVKFPSQAYTLDPETPQFEAIKQIRELHTQADMYLLGSKFSRYTAGSEEGWSEILATELLNSANYSSIMETLADEEDIVKDMSNMIALVDIATTQFEPDALRYIHRILHDLDLYGYPDQSKQAYDFWGATHSVASSNSSQLDEITAYIEAKRPAE